MTGVEKAKANDERSRRKLRRNPVPQKKLTAEEKRRSHLFMNGLEINKKIIQEKQGKDKPEKRVELNVRTV